MPVLLILHSQMVAGCITMFLARIESKLALTQDKLVVNTVVLEILPLTARSLLAVGAIFIPIGCVELIVKFWLRPEFMYDKFVMKDTCISLIFKFSTFVIVIAFKFIIWALFTPNK